MLKISNISLKFLNFLSVLLLFLSGCAKLPCSVAVSVEERLAAESSFKEMLAAHRECGRCCDADVIVTLESPLRYGTFSGYLEVMPPSYLKFVGLNPLGQPLVVLNTDGRNFQYVVVPEAMGYEGSVRAKAFENYSPEGFMPEVSYYFLTGRLWPEPPPISDVGKDPDTMGYWITFISDNGSKQSLVLFEPHEKYLLRHLVLDRNGSILMDIQYGDYQLTDPKAKDGGRTCRLPGTITLTSGSHNGVLKLSLRDWATDVSFCEKDFWVEIPAGFKRVIVK